MIVDRSARRCPKHQLKFMMANVTFKNTDCRIAARLDGEQA
jgi:hypothetical protein